MDSKEPEALKPVGKSKATRMRKKSSPSTGRIVDDGMTCEPFRRVPMSSTTLGEDWQQAPLVPTLNGTLPLMLGEWTLSAAGSLARTFQSLDSKKVFQASEAGYGLSTRESFARYDRDSRSWRTPQGCLIEGWATFSGRWPKSGTMRNGLLFRRAQWVRHFHEKECSLWPSPRASDRDNCGGSNARSKAKRNGTYVGRDLNPEFQELLMGFPINWTALPPSETPLSRKLPSGSGIES